MGAAFDRKTSRSIRYGLIGLLALERVHAIRKARALAAAGDAPEAEPEAGVKPPKKRGWFG